MPSQPFEKLPPFLKPGTTVGDVQRARARYEKVQQNSAHSMTAGPRRAALAAKLASAMPITPDEWVEFGAIIPKSYRYRIDNSRSDAIAKENERRAEWERKEAERKAALAKRPHVITDPREAQERLSTADYNAWLALPQNQKAVAERYG